MKIVIAGCGKIGTTIIKYLCKEGHSITVIDKNRELINEIINVYDVGGIVGSATSVELLREANAHKCDIFISVCNEDETNFVSCSLAKVIGAKKTVARFRDTDYTEQAEVMREIFGIDMLINPELAVAKELFNRLRFPYSSDVTTFEKGKAFSVEVRVPENCPIGNKSVHEFVGEFDFKFVVGAIKHLDDSIEIPNGDSVIENGDTLNIVSTPENIDIIFKKMGVFNQRVKSVFIVGGSRIAYHLAGFLSEANIEVKIIEHRNERCRQLAEKIDSNVEIVHADGTNEQILEEEGISSYDACITLTGLDEENILVSLFAKQSGVETVITKVTNDRLDEILNKLDLNKKISQKKVTVNQILYFIRSIRAKEENTIEKLRKIMEEKLELAEFNVNGNEDFVNKMVKDLKFKSGVLIACIIRKNKVIVPSGETIFEDDDKIIILTKSGVKSLDNILR